MIKEIEEFSMNAWPALQTKLYDGWVLRFADGYTKRANSVNPIYESTMPIDFKIEFCEKEFSRHKLPIVFKLTTNSFPKGIEEKLKDRGYTRLDETSVKILEICKYKFREPEAIIIERELSDSWFEGFLSCSNITDKKDQSTSRKILDNISGEIISVRKQVAGKTVGCGFGVIEREHIGIFDVIVDANFRRNGYGQDIMDGILGTALKRNAKKAYLQVVVGNSSAEKLYDNIGFKEVYRYWYRKKEL